MTYILAKALVVVAMSSASSAHHTARFPVAPRHQGVDTLSPTDTARLKPPAFPVIGKPASQLITTHWLNVASGSAMTFGDGHVYILDFTAIWCGSCPDTYPIVSAILDQYKSQGVRAIYVTALWGLGEDHMSQLTPDTELAALPKYFAVHQVTAPVAIFDSLATLLRGYSDDGQGNIALPKLVVIDGHGIVRDVLTGWDAEKARRQLFADVATIMQPPKTL